jgi:menaquinone-dependent protoporphyrinogen oxidase
MDRAPRVLLLYATREGQTEKVARRIGEVMRGLGAELLSMNAGSGNQPGDEELQRFDLLLFGASMHAGGIEAELVEFIEQHQDRIRRQRRHFFLVLLSAAARDPELRQRWLGDARSKVDAQLTLRFDDIEMIAGALRYSRYPLPLKWLMRRIARQAGEGTDIDRDYEYTDWQQVDDYARRMVALAREGSGDEQG